MTWHADTAVLTRYRGGTLPEPHASSVEAHLLTCASCRQAIAALTPEPDRMRLATVWEEIVAAADEPRASTVERILVRIGVRDHLARLLAATPSLTASWLAAVATTLLFAVLAARGDGERGLLLFLLVAPLLPLAGVAAAFGPRAEPAHEIAVAAPMHGFHLLLVRTAAVLVTTVALAGAASLALPGVGWDAATWLLPALALTISALVLATWFPVTLSAAALAVGWIGLTLGTVGVRALRLDQGSAALERAVAFQPAGQLVFAALALAAAALLLHRRDAFEVGGLA
jgi:hypothetical protein